MECTLVMLTSALELNEGTAKSNSCNMCFPGYKDQHCDPGNNKDQLKITTMLDGCASMKARHVVTLPL